MISVKCAHCSGDMDVTTYSYSNDVELLVICPFCVNEHVELLDNYDKANTRITELETFIEEYIKA